MITVGAFDAKTRFSELLEQAAAGEEILVTKRGKPVARIVGVAAEQKLNGRNVFEELKRIRKGARLDGISWKELRDAGRR